MPGFPDFTLYHRAVRDVRGDALLPPNALRDTFPDIYQREAAKYEGRKALRSEPVTSRTAPGVTSCFSHRFIPAGC
ncbi:hypothetical protein [Deinococcus navajonensis]|uniref:Uncharacterized protein n=1 Tax=Deinococcus navajonensis TaxID=309884 RepID=A0ABV8XQ06_9DEIO